MRISRVLGVALLVTAVAACGGSDDDDDDGVGPGTPVFTTLDIQPATVTVAPQATQALTATAKDQNGATMSGLTVTYTSSDQTRATVSPAGVVTGVAVGTATVTATGTVSGVVKTQAVNVTVANPGNPGQTASVTATTGNAFNPQSVTIVPNGTVTWTFQALHNVTFGSGGPGNITDKASGSESRTFPTAGTFNYNCTIHPGMSGTVRVQ